MQAESRLVKGRPATQTTSVFYLSAGRSLRRCHQETDVTRDVNVRDANERLRDFPRSGNIISYIS